MQAVADFPIDPELIQAVEAAVPWQLDTLVNIPKSWVRVAPPKTQKRKPNSAKRARMRKQLCKQQRNRCFYCGTQFNEDLPATLDHLIPYLVVRNWDVKNLVAACEPCNSAKGGFVHEPFMPLLSALVYRLATLHAVAKAGV